MKGWDEYLDYLDESTHSVRLITSSLAPRAPAPHPENVEIPWLGYTLWPFQRQILSGLCESTLILGLARAREPPKVEVYF